MASTEISVHDWIYKGYEIEFRALLNEETLKVELVLV